MGRICIGCLLEGRDIFGTMGCILCCVYISSDGMGYTNGVSEYYLSVIGVGAAWRYLYSGKVSRTFRRNL